MIKKYSFNDDYYHTQMVLVGRKTHLIIPAPADPGAKEFHIIDGRLVFTGWNGSTVESYRLPLASGCTYKIMMPYRALRHGVNKDEKDIGKKYGWRDKRAVPLDKLPSSFIVNSVDYKPLEDVTIEEWVGNGIDENENLLYSFNAYEDIDIKNVYTYMMMCMFNYIPKYVYVCEIAMASKNNPDYPIIYEQ